MNSSTSTSPRNIVFQSNQPLVQSKQSSDNLLNNKSRPLLLNYKQSHQQSSSPTSSPLNLSTSLKKLKNTPIGEPPPSIKDTNSYSNSYFYQPLLKQKSHLQFNLRNSHERSPRNPSISEQKSLLQLQTLSKPALDQKQDTQIQFQTTTTSEEESYSTQTPLTSITKLTQPRFTAKDKSLPRTLKPSQKSSPSPDKLQNSSSKILRKRQNNTQQEIKPKEFFQQNDQLAQCDTATKLKLSPNRNPPLQIQEHNEIKEPNPYQITQTPKQIIVNPTNKSPQNLKKSSSFSILKQKNTNQETIGLVLSHKIEQLSRKFPNQPSNRSPISLKNSPENKQLADTKTQTNPSEQKQQLQTQLISATASSSVIAKSSTNTLIVIDTSIRTKLLPTNFDHFTHFDPFDQSPKNSELTYATSISRALLSSSLNGPVRKEFSNEPLTQFLPTTTQAVPKTEHKQQQNQQIRESCATTAGISMRVVSSYDLNSHSNLANPPLTLAQSAQPTSQLKIKPKKNPNNNHHPQTQQAILEQQYQNQFLALLQDQHALQEQQQQQHKSKVRSQSIIPEEQKKQEQSQSQNILQTEFQISQQEKSCQDNLVSSNQTSNKDTNSPAPPPNQPRLSKRINLHKNPQPQSQLSHPTIKQNSPQLPHHHKQLFSNPAINSKISPTTISRNSPASRAQKTQKKTQSYIRSSYFDFSPANRINTNIQENNNPPIQPNSFSSFCERLQTNHSEDPSDKKDNSESLLRSQDIHEYHMMHRKSNIEPQNHINNTLEQQPQSSHPRLYIKEISFPLNRNENYQHPHNNQSPNHTHNHIHTHTHKPNNSNKVKVILRLPRHSKEEKTQPNSNTSASSTVIMKIPIQESPIQSEKSLNSSVSSSSIDSEHSASPRPISKLLHKQMPRFSGIITGTKVLTPKAISNSQTPRTNHTYLTTTAATSTTNTKRPSIELNPPSQRISHSPCKQHSNRHHHFTEFRYPLPPTHKSSSFLVSTHPYLTVMPTANQSKEELLRKDIGTSPIESISEFIRPSTSASSKNIQYKSESHSTNILEEKSPKTNGTNSEQIYFEKIVDQTQLNKEKISESLHLLQSD